MNHYHICDMADRTVNRVCPKHGEALVIGLDELFCDIGHFWHNEFNACDYSEPLPEDIRLRRMGAPSLFEAAS